VEKIQLRAMSGQTSQNSVLYLDLKVWEQVLMLVEFEAEAEARKTCDLVMVLGTLQVVLIWLVVGVLDVLGRVERMVRVELLVVALQVE
jgi:hypothetical protein